METKNKTMSKIDYKPLIEKFKIGNLSQFIPVLISLLVIWSYFATIEPAFLTPRNLHFLFMQSAIVATLAIGVTIVLLIGHIDLSIAAVAGIGGAVLAVLLTKMGFSPLISCLAAVLVGMSLGFIQGCLVAYVGIPSFVVTLAGLLGFQGLMLKILGNHGAINMRDPVIRGLTTTSIPSEIGWGIAFLIVGIVSLILLKKNKQRQQRMLEVKPVFYSILLLAIAIFGIVAIFNAYRGIPILFLVLGAITTLLWWVTTSTPFGRYLFAIGGNTESARRVGIPVKKIQVAAFTIVGLMAAIGGIIGASRYASVSFNAFAGGPLLLEAIGAAVVGGTSLFGGKGSVWNALLGALVIGSLGNGLDLSGASAADKLMVSGLILLLAVTLDALSRKKI